MAKLEAPVNNSNPYAELIGDDLAPAGTYVSTVLDVKDEFGVERLKYQSTEKEMVDLTCFLFGFRDAQAQPHRVSSKRMKISGNEKSALFGFLKGLLGQAPQYGWDYCELKGRQCLLTVEHIARHDGSGVFAAIAALSPVPQGMGVAGGQMQAPGSLNHECTPMATNGGAQLPGGGVNSGGMLPAGISAPAGSMGAGAAVAAPAVTPPPQAVPPVVQPAGDVPLAADDPIPF